VFQRGGSMSILWGRLATVVGNRLATCGRLRIGLCPLWRTPQTNGERPAAR
jgi:hypothetical protein